MTSLFGWLGLIPDDVLVETISKHLELRDVAHMIRLNSQFAKALSADDVWKILWSRHFPSVAVPASGSIKNRFKDTYERRDFVFGEWRITSRRGVFFIYDLMSDHTITAAITHDTYAFASKNISMNWDLQQTHRSPPSIKVHTSSASIVSDPEFLECFALPYEVGKRACRDLPPLPEPRGRFHSVQYVIAETGVPGGPREEYLHLWHAACPVVLLLGRTSNGWGALRVRAAEALSESAVLAGGCKNSEVILFPHTQKGDFGDLMECDA